MTRYWLSLALSLVLAASVSFGCRQKTVEEQVEEALRKAPPPGSVPMPEGETVPGTMIPGAPASAQPRMSGGGEEEGAGAGESGDETADDMDAEGQMEEEEPSAPHQGSGETGSGG